MFLLIFLFLFLIHLNQKKEISKTITNYLSRSIRITKDLSKLKKRELNILAKTLVYGPIVRSTLSTKHRETIQDTLNNLALKNNLDFILILENKRPIYHSNHKTINFSKKLKNILAGYFIGVTSFKEQSLKNLTFLIGQSLKKTDLDLWSNISGVFYQSYNNQNIKIATNMPKSYSFKPNAYIKKHFKTSEDGKYYYQSLGLLKNTLNIIIALKKSPFWVTFYKKRNRFILFGLIIFLIGIFISILATIVIEKIIIKNTIHQNDQVQYDLIIEEINRFKEDTIVGIIKNDV